MSQNIKILVVGDIMLDHYLWGDCSRISPEAPVGIVDVNNESYFLGGGGNVANNLKAFEVDTCILSVVGEDIWADKIISLLKEKNIDNFIVKESKRKTTKKSRVIAANSHIVRYDNETKKAIADSSREKIFNHFKSICHNFDVILLSDYQKGIFKNSLCEDIISYSNSINKKVLIDPKSDDFSKYKNAFLITPNKKELQNALGVKLDNKNIKYSLKKMQDIANVKIPLVTLSEDGIAYINNNDFHINASKKQDIYDVTGAGDTVLASLGYMIAKDKNINESVEFANIAASIVISKVGCASATLDEIYQITNKEKEEIKIIGENELIQKLENNNKKIIFTNGCFDLLHRGHCEYLKKAKNLGDILIVALNSDKSVKKLKGKNRPINTQEDRAYVLSCLSFVDFVVIFDDLTPYNLISKIKPDVLVKGSDYKDKEVIGSDIVKEVVLIDFVQNKSTSMMIDKISAFDS